jgi:hypothetical protein
VAAPPTIRQQSSYKSIRSHPPRMTPPIELAPIASTSTSTSTYHNHPHSTSQSQSQTTTSNTTEPPLSPAPFSSLIPRPAEWGPAPTHDPHPSLGRKPSLLKKPSAPHLVASRQASTMSIGTRYQQQQGVGLGQVGSGAGTGSQQQRMGGAEYFSNPRPVPVPRNPRIPVGQAQMGLRAEAGQMQGQRHGNNKEEVSKGCGCVIM